MRRFVWWLCCVLVPLAVVRAQDPDPFDPLEFDEIFPEVKVEPEADRKKSPEQLIAEAEALWKQERYLDGRTKLLIALKKDPRNYRIHERLARYYLGVVGHFRLALQYVKQADALFKEKYGQPPYRNFTAQLDHMQLLYLLSQTRLNLDNYQGALDVLDEIARRGYYADWYAGSRSWILMKLGRVPEAIKTAQLGYLALAGQDERGQILNMLGILYSMSGDRPKALEIFRQAVAQELSQGALGKPATPLNNAGEVYKEIFDDEKAETSWLRATGMPDGCEHVLPAVNLALLYLDQLNLVGAKKALDNFEACVKNFPLRNGEEHRALVHLMRGRIALLAGKIDAAVSHFEGALVRKQWFGKIGTSEKDLQAAAMMSLAQALARKRAVQRLGHVLSRRGFVGRTVDNADLSLRAWWYMRRARQLLTLKLNSFEDISIRNTDSMLEYPTLGELTAGIPRRLLERRIEQELKVDHRPEALPYYQAYLAERALAAGEQSRAMDLTRTVLSTLRPRFDNFLRLRVLLLQLAMLDPAVSDYRAVANTVFSLNRPALRSYGYKLPVNFDVADERILQLLRKTPFLLDNSSRLQYLIRSDFKEGEFILEFSAHSGVIGNMRVKSADLMYAMRKLVEEVFVVEL